MTTLSHIGLEERMILDMGTIATTRWIRGHIEGYSDTQCDKRGSVSKTILF